MAMGCPSLQKIMAKSMAICHFPKRHSFRAHVKAKDPLFPTTFPTFFQGGYEMGKLRNPYPRLGFDKRVP